MFQFNSCGYLYVQQIMLLVLFSLLVHCGWWYAPKGLTIIDGSLLSSSLQETQPRW